MTGILTPRTPTEAGVDPAGIARFLDALEADPRVRPHGLVMLRDGHRIADGHWAPYAADRVNLLYSLSKSFTSTAAGLARQEGLLDLDATVLSYFPELDADITDPRSRAMRVRHIAAMSSGHAGETLELAAQRDPADLVRGFLLTPPDAEPGTLFAYNQPCTYTLAAIVQRVTGSTLVEYLRPRLFDPLGIGEVAWVQHPPGRDLGFSGLHATTEAVARLGELYRRGGMWGERRILDAEWVALATSRHIPTPAGEPDWSQGYGFQFWMSRHGYRGDGAYGQFCVVVPEAGLVVALTSESDPMQPVLDALWEHVLPAIDRGGDPSGDEQLAARLSRLTVPVPRAEAAPADPARWADAGFAADGGSVPLGSVRVMLARDGEESRLRLVDDEGELEVPFATGRWATAEPDGMPVAASGGWVDDELRVDVLFLEKPHTLRVTCSAGTGRATVAWRTTPLHDGRIRAQRRP